MTFYRIWVYLLPMPMWFVEFFMRLKMGSPAANDFFPSSLAAAALGMVIPVLAPKPVIPTAGMVIPPGLLLVN